MTSISSKHISFTITSNEPFSKDSFRKEFDLPESCIQERGIHKASEILSKERVLIDPKKLGDITITIDNKTVSEHQIEFNFETRKQKEAFLRKLTGAKFVEESDLEEAISINLKKSKDFLQNLTKLIEDTNKEFSDKVKILEEMIDSAKQINILLPEFNEPFSETLNEEQIVKIYRKIKTHLVSN